MILGLGTDIAYIPRFASILVTKHPKYVARLAQRVLHPKYELPAFQELYDSTHFQKPLPEAESVNLKGKAGGNCNVQAGQESVQKAAQYLAARWAVKEALYKSLDPIDQLHCRFNHWYKTNMLDPALKQRLEKMEPASELEQKPSLIGGTENFKSRRRDVTGKGNESETDPEHGVDESLLIPSRKNLLVNIDRFRKPCIVNEKYSRNHPTEKFHLSLSHDHDYVYATVIRECIHR